MKIDKWCTNCLMWLDDSAHPQTEDHSKFTQYRVDGQAGGRGGQRVRKNFLNKANAVKFARDLEVSAETYGVGLVGDLRVCQLIDKFTDECAVKFRGFKGEAYKLKALFKYFEVKGNPKVKDIDLKDGKAYVRYLEVAGLKPASINRHITLLKRVFSWAVEEELLHLSPFAKKLKKVDGEKPHDRWLTEEESESLLAACRNVSPSLWECVYIALNTGFRLNNVVNLKWADVQETKIWARDTKTGEDYFVPLSDDLRMALASFSRRDAYVCDSTGLRTRFEEALKMSGLWRHPDDREKVTFHTLRHTFASCWLQRGTPIRTVADWLGHKSIVMLEKTYGRLSEQHHLEQINKFPAIGRRLVDTQLLSANENASKSNGPPRNRTGNLVLKRDGDCHTDVTATAEENTKNE
jgi:integrase